MSPGFTIWITGLPGSGKMALAQALAERLPQPVEIIDSAKLRASPLGASLGFSREDRDLNCGRHAFAARLLTRNGVIGIVKAVSPYQATRDAIRADLGRFVEVHVSTSREVCIDRDPKGVWARALAGEIRNFTGVDDPYEEPTHPDARVDLGVLPANEAAEAVLEALSRLGYVSGGAGDEEAAIQQRLEQGGFTTT